MRVIILILVGVALVGGIVYALRGGEPAAGPIVPVPEENGVANCVCTKEYNPVCGIDGKTYGNACMANCAEVAIRSAGECAEPAAPIPAPAPAPEPDMCICTAQYDPVCGADGKTYGNACTAACAKAVVAFAGECPSP